MGACEIFCGTGVSDRAARIDEIVAGHWGRALLALPGRAQARERTEALLLGRGCAPCLGDPVCELNALAKRVLTAGAERAELLDDFDRSLLMEGCLAGAAAAGSFDSLKTRPDSPGLVRHMLQLITAIKQAAVEPGEFMARIGGLAEKGPFDLLVAEVYGRYQKLLTERGFYDVPGLYWRAGQLCGEARVAGLEGIDLVALDGFDDFTPSQLRFVAKLERHVPRLVIGLNCDTAPDRADLFTLPHRALAALRSALKDTVVVECPSAPPQSACEYAAAHLAWRDRPDAPSPGLRRDVRLMPCLDAQHEADQIARSIKRLAAGGAAPGRMAVVGPDMGALAVPLVAALGRCGLAGRFRHRPALSESGPGRFLAQLISAVDGWPRDRVAAVLASPWFNPAPCAPERLRAFHRLSRDAGIVGGRLEWVSRMELLARRLGHQDGGGERETVPPPGAVESLAAMRGRFDALCALVDALPEEASQAEFAAAFQAALDAVNPGAGLEAVEPERRDGEHAALAGISGLLETLHQSGFPERILGRGEFFTLLQQGLSMEGMTAPAPQNAVVCADLSHVKGERFDYVFLAGANEGMLPGPSPANAVFTAEDVARLGEGDVVALDGAEEHSMRQRLLLHHLLLAPEKGLVVSWRMQSREGRTALPAAFVKELLELLPPPLLEQPAVPLAENLLAVPAEAASAHDALLACMTRDNIEAPECAGALPLLREAAAVEGTRLDASPFGPYDGVLEGPDSLEWLAERYGPEHQFSAHQLERYNTCPYGFFAEQVLGISEEDPPSEDILPKLRGTLFHGVLQRIYEGLDGPLSDVDAALARLDGALEAVFAENAPRLETVPPALLEAERGRMRVQLERFLKRHAALDEETDYRPAAFEAAFGRSHRAAAEEESPEPLRLETPEGVVCVGGRIDRIDRSGDKARVIDYKTGAVPKGADIYKGKDLQMGLYIKAVEHVLMPGSTVERAWYCSVGKNKDQEATGAKAKQKKVDWLKREENMTAAVAKAVRGIREGSFPPNPADLEKPRCPESGRYKQARVARKTGMPEISDPDAEGEE